MDIFIDLPPTAYAWKKSLNPSSFGEKAFGTYNTLSFTTTTSTLALFEHWLVSPRDKVISYTVVTNGLAIALGQVSQSKLTDGLHVKRSLAVGNGEMVGCNNTLSPSLIVSV